MTATQSAPRTARERARAELTREIKEGARRQLAATGADGISLRAVARELGMASSALYRYFPSRDDLLTALIIDAYQALGDAVDRAVAAVPIAELRRRWFVICRSTREWAIEHPHEYALIFGSPVPGYEAPQDTVQPAIRVPLALVGVLSDGWFAKLLAHPYPEEAVAPTLATQVGRVTRAAAPGLPPWLMARGLIAWSQLFGMLSFELFGQFVGSVNPTDDFFDHAVGMMADFVGLPE